MGVGREGVALAVPIRPAGAERGTQHVHALVQMHLEPVAVFVAVPIVAEAVDEPLLADLERVAAVAAVCRIAQAVVEHADARACHVVLVGVAVGAGGETFR